MWLDVRSRPGKGTSRPGGVAAKSGQLGLRSRHHVGGRDMGVCKGSRDMASRRSRKGLSRLDVATSLRGRDMGSNMGGSG